MSDPAPGTALVLEPYDTPTHPVAPWFADMRRERRRHYASRSPRRVPPRRAIITIVHNERVFLPIWLSYYSRFFSPRDIYVLDNESTDGSTSRPGFVRIPVTHDRVDHTWMVRTIEDLQHDLLGRYDLVVVTDVDEIIAPAPQVGTLGAYLDRFDEEWVNCLGYELLHQRDREPALRLDLPILDQRHCWFFNGGYDKAAAATVPMHWRPGFHGREDFQYHLDPDLRLIHLHRMDYGICLQRHRTRQRRTWAEHDTRKGWARHNQIIEEAEFERWFYQDSCFDGFEIQPEEIQAPWGGLF